MAIPLTGSGGLFPRLGRIFGTIDLVNAQRGEAVGDAINLIVSAYDGDEPLTDRIYGSLESHRGSSGGLTGVLQSLARSTVIEMVRDDLPQPNLTLSTALVELIRQMDAANQTVAGTTLGTAVVPEPGNTGNATLLVSTQGEDGAALGTLIPELVVGTVTADGQPGGGASAFREPLRLAGQYRVEPLDWQWPVGSGSSVTINAVTAADGERGGPGTWLANGDFASYSGSPPAPSRWAILVGSAGVNVVIDSSEGYREATALAIPGGATNTTLQQVFGSASGSRLAMTPRTALALGIRLKLDASAAAGVLRVALVDGVGSILDDDAGTPCSVAIDLTAVGTGYTLRTALFRTPRVLPETVALELRLTTALTAGRTLFVDEVVLAGMTPLYRGGPRFTLISGDTPLIAGDRYDVTLTNTNLTGFQAWFDRVFGMRSLGLALPVSGSPTISDSLINVIASS